jgi:hypothetical protein
MRPVAKEISLFRVNVVRIICFSSALCVVAVAESAQAAQFQHPRLGYSLTYPDNWHRYLVGDVLVLTSFDGSLPGGLVPEGGAYINVQVRGVEESDDKLLDELERHIPGSRAQETINGKVSPRLEQTYDLGPNEYTRVAIPRRIGGKHLLFILKYYRGDPSARAWQEIFRGVIASVTVTAE